MPDAVMQLEPTDLRRLFLPCTYEQRFAAKQAIDSFFVRVGTCSRPRPSSREPFVALPARGFAAVNAALAIAALILAWRVGRYYKTLTSRAAPSTAA